MSMYNRTMSKSSSHVSQKQTPRKRQYPGEHQAGLLIAWLEKNKSRERGRRVASLLRDMRAALGMYEPRWEPTPDGPFRRTISVEAGREYERLQRRINRTLSYYRLSPEINFYQPPHLTRWEVFWHVPGTRMVYPAVCNSEPDAISAVLRLAEKGVVHRVRECRQCGRWLFARFEHQEFCGQKCQLAHYHSSDQWKDHRREWMRDYRRKKEALEQGRKPVEEMKRPPRKGRRGKHAKAEKV
jgi:hypothetical protein